MRNEETTVVNSTIEVESVEQGETGTVPYITIRLSRVAFDRLEALRSQHGSAEFRPARAQVLRAVIDKGFEAMDKRADLKRRVHEVKTEALADLGTRAVLEGLATEKPKSSKAKKRGKK